MKEFDIYKNREPVEWTNTWMENCQDKDKSHWLLIGGSVARNLRSKISSLVPEAVDFIGTSSLYEDPCFYNIFNAFFENNVYHYSKIFLMLGKHGYSPNLMTYNNETNSKYYAKLMGEFIDYLSKYCEEVVIILNPPNKKVDNVKEWDEITNNEIYARNMVHKSVGEAKNLKVIDLYSLCYTNNYAQCDHVHYETAQINQKIAQFIIDNLNNVHKDFAFYQEKTSRIIINIFGIKIKFRLPIKL